MSLDAHENELEQKRVALAVGLTVGIVCFVGLLVGVVVIYRNHKKAVARKKLEAEEREAANAMCATTVRDSMRTPPLSSIEMFRMSRPVSAVALPHQARVHPPSYPAGGIQAAAAAAAAAAANGLPNTDDLPPPVYPVGYPGTHNLQRQDRLILAPIPTVTAPSWLAASEEYNAHRSHSGFTASPAALSAAERKTRRKKKQKKENEEKGEDVVVYDDDAKNEEIEVPEDVETWTPVLQTLEGESVLVGVSTFVWHSTMSIYVRSFYTTLQLLASSRKCTRKARRRRRSDKMMSTVSSWNGYACVCVCVCACLICLFAGTYFYTHIYVLA
jgi:hypothetical protein